MRTRARLHRFNASANPEVARGLIHNLIRRCAIDQLSCRPQLT